MFIARNKVRMHDTDMAGLLYFARQFRFTHDALEDFVESEGFCFDHVIHVENFAFVIVHCQANYFKPIKVGDDLEVHVAIDNIGNTSFRVDYQIYRTDDMLIGSAQTTHVTLNRISRKKLPIPPKFKQMLEKHLKQ